jgi:hypothetical protein
MPFVRCKRKLKLSSADSESSSKKCKQGYGGVCVGGSAESGSRFCIGGVGRYLATVKMFSHLI